MATIDDYAPDAVLLPGQVAELLGIGGKTLARWSDAGRIRCVRSGPKGHRRYSVDAVREVLAADSIRKASTTAEVDAAIAAALQTRFKVCDDLVTLNLRRAALTVLEHFPKATIIVCDTSVNEYGRPEMDLDKVIDDQGVIADAGHELDRTDADGDQFDLLYDEVRQYLGDAHEFTVDTGDDLESTMRYAVSPDGLTVTDPNTRSTP